MLLADVNVFIYAFRTESPRHDGYRRWLEEHLAGPEAFGVSELVLSSFVRIVTNHRIYREPTAIDKALGFCEAVLSAPAAIPVRSGPRQWGIFGDLCRTAGVRGNMVPDAYLAAMAIEIGARLVTADRGFLRYAGLSVVEPLAG